MPSGVPGIYGSARTAAIRGAAIITRQAELRARIFTFPIFHGDMKAPRKISATHFLIQSRDLTCVGVCAGAVYTDWASG